MNHLFKVALNWIKKEPQTDSSTRIYTKSHHISIEGKPDLEVSAAKTFKGDPNLYNPEDLLLSSLTSCHMMSYLYCCTQHKIEVISNQDHSEATLQINPDGSGKIIKVDLFPEIIISNSSQIELALSLHKKANELCFIANSCNFPVYHHAKCSAK
ncbi:OsmC family protein [Empedobacter falsenii]|uniref:Osmotically inducible protein OsmC n=1 Tax=Empedobacter falsenii TaxID=343874 RepID=A0A3R8TNM1_9FLAO|nr:OsmC family protein [Empedobacter falsenii]RRT88682.1 osmotically inducible protein OsmC [Empedobacter falsenii]RRT89577.1 osmotically inducible protein OsmC [Empedobacter falsenii]